VLADFSEQGRIIREDAPVIPGVELSQFLHDIGPAVYFIVPLIIFTETGLMLGFFLPGDSLLFTAGALAGLGIIDVNIFLLCMLLFVAAVIGNSTGYLIGKYGGRRLFRKKDSKIFKKEYLRQAEAFYDKHGGKAVILAQFMPIIRTFNPVVTGISKMHYVKFITFNMIGAFLWAVCVTLLGFFTFRAFGELIDPEKIDMYLLPIIVLIVLISISPMIVHVLRDPKARKAIAAKIRNIFKRSKVE
jgi:membrane-associated protein